MCKNFNEFTPFEPKQWGDERMDEIGRNGNDGIAYDIRLNNGG